ncbi:sarcalumenin-like isoform X1 [Tachypleus tridentatus]|uniref:sarcalumenin-like isoform X1 n=1 Tax=Tachypleus tridentatus TaxID=6853 RepID=UPI003FD1B0F2
MATAHVTYWHPESPTTKMATISQRIRFYIRLTVLIIVLMKVLTHETRGEKELTTAADIQCEDESSILATSTLEEDEAYQQIQHYGQKNRDHIHKVLQLDEKPKNTQEILVSDILGKLNELYETDIKPLGKAYHFHDLKQRKVDNGEIFASPRVLIMGPWSTGKSSLINYLLGIENDTYALATGAQPTTSEFTVMMNGKEYKTVEGAVIAMNKSYRALEKFGQSFLERLMGIQIPHPLLEKMNIIDTPGIIENRKQQERGYPFNNVCQWFIDRADIILVVFDPTKLDVGTELEVLFKLLKGHEGKVRIILNKADSLTPQELMRVYGALFWSLSPLINVTEPPRVYVGSFWSKKYNLISEPNGKLFMEEELTLLKDLHEIVANRIENKIALIRQNAIQVRNHALLVAQYLHVFQDKKSIFKNNKEIEEHLIENPEEYRIFDTVLAYPDISKYDLPLPEQYHEFFKIHPIESFLPLAKHCPFYGPCPLERVEHAIHEKIPSLLEELYNQRIHNCKTMGHCGMNWDHATNKYRRNGNP